MMRRSLSGSPMRPRNTDDGKISANSSVKLHSPRSTNASMNSLTRRVMSASCSSIRFGAKSGSISLRYFEWFGGSTLSGIIGRTFPRFISTRDENSSWLRSTNSVSSRLNVMAMPSAGRTIPSPSSTCRYIGWGAARFERSLHVHLRGAVDVGDVVDARSCATPPCVLGHGRRVRTAYGYTPIGPRDQSLTVSRAAMTQPPLTRRAWSRYCTPITRSSRSEPGGSMCTATA